MGKTRDTAEKIVSRLRQVDVFTALGHGVVDAIRMIGDEIKPRDEPLKREIFVRADQGMGEETETGEALGYRTLRCGRLMNGPSGPAAIGQPTVSGNPKPCRHMIA